MRSKYIGIQRRSDGRAMTQRRRSDGPATGLPVGLDVPAGREPTTLGAVIQSSGVRSTSVVAWARNHLRPNRSLSQGLKTRDCCAVRARPGPASTIDRRRWLAQDRCRVPTRSTLPHTAFPSTAVNSATTPQSSRPLRSQRFLPSRPDVLFPTDVKALRLKAPESTYRSGMAFVRVA